MFTQIQVAIDTLKATIDNELEYISMVRSNEQNPNMFAEYGGRTIGLTWAMREIDKTQVEIDNHIAEILKNTTDGNYIAKLGVLEDENRVLRDKIYLLEQDIKRYKDMQKKSSKKQQHLECLKELSDEEINNKIEEKYSDNYLEGYDE